MPITHKTIENFYQEDKVALAKTLIEQLKNNFKVLVKMIPNLETIEWQSTQQDEMLFELTYFKIIKTNGYFCENKYDGASLNINIHEFNSTEVELILAFQKYLRKLSKTSVYILGHNIFSLENDLIMGDGVSFRIV